MSNIHGLASGKYGVAQVYGFADSTTLLVKAHMLLKCHLSLPLPVRLFHWHLGYEAYMPFLLWKLILSYMYMYTATGLLDSTYPMWPKFVTSRMIASSHISTSSLKSFTRMFQSTLFLHPLIANTLHWLTLAHCMAVWKLGVNTIDFLPLLVTSTHLAEQGLLHFVYC